MLFFVAAYFWVMFPYRDVWDREMRCFPAAFWLLAVGCTATRYQMQRGPAKPLTLLLVIIPSIWILWHQRVWFASALHDIALKFYSHGRFGCQSIDERGNPYFTFRDNTVPWLLIGPPLLVGLAQACISKALFVELGERVTRSFNRLIRK